MAKTLAISPKLKLPLDAVTETFWFTGKRGSGKTHDCSVLVEEMLYAGAQVVILDPMRAWYGLRSSIDGKSAGIPIAIFGGPKGDLPLRPIDGEFMAELAVRERVSMILDIKDWSKANRCRFVEAFLLKLLAINTEAMHLVLEEAARFAPQRPERDETKMLGACMDIVQLGRGSGIGASLVSQRSATINNEVSSQTSVLVAHRTLMKADRIAMQGWFEYHDSDLVAEAMKRIPSLPTGTAIITSTELFDDDYFAEVPFRARQTFDSSATPKVGKVKKEAKTLADIDLSAIRSQMAEVIEEVEANDPRKLKTEINFLRNEKTRLQRELESVTRQRDDSMAREAIAAATEPVEIEVPVPWLPPEWVEKVRSSLGECVATLDALVAEQGEPLHRGVPRRRTPAPAPKGTSRGTPRRTEQQPQSPKAQVKPAPKRDIPVDTDVSLSGPDRKVLTILATYGPRSNRQLAMQAGYSANKSTLGVVLSRLRKAGFVSLGQPIGITDDGLTVLGDYEPLPTGEELLTYWYGQLPGADAKALKLFVENAPDDLSNEYVCEELGYDPTKSTLGVVLSRLRRLELLEGWHVHPDFIEAVS